MEMQNTFTTRQMDHIRKSLDTVMNVGTAHICLTDFSKDSVDAENNIQWFDVRASSTFEEEKVYKIRVGQVKGDRRRSVYTALSLDQ